MKPIKMFGLAALAALMAMAFVGASSAMATDPTALCKVDPGTGAHEVCPRTAMEIELNERNNFVSHVHETTPAGHKAILKTSLLTIECEVLFLGDVSTSGRLAAAGVKLAITGLHDVGPPLIGAFVYSNCNNNCTAIEENGPPTIEVLKTGHETAEVTGEGLVHVKCGSSIDCSYNGVGLKGTAKGPLLAKKNEKGEVENPNGEVSLVAQSTAKETGGFLCPKTSELTITTTPLEAVYITE